MKDYSKVKLYSKCKICGKAFIVTDMDNKITCSEECYKLLPQKYKNIKSEKSKPKQELPIFENYNQYLNSKIWKKKRAKILRKYKNKCAICGEKATQVHHLKYTKWGTEKKNQLIAICAKCHMNIHNIETKDTPAFKKYLNLN